MNESRELLRARRFRVLETQVSTVNGPLDYQYVKHPGAVVVVPRLADGSVCLIRNHRVAVGETLIEAPAGTLEPGEPPQETAHRELIEETGYRAGVMTALPPFSMSPGILDERMHPFLATDLIAGAPDREPSEQIENLVVPWSEALELVRRGEIADAKTVAVLLYCHCFLESA